MKITELWNVNALLEKISRARRDLREAPHKCFVRKDGGRACLVDVVASPSHHQTREIAEAFALEYDELLMNERETEVFRKNLADRVGELLAELHQRVLTPEDYSFFFGYDPEGNFGLLLHQNPPSGKEEERRKKKCFLPPFLEAREGAGS